MAFTSPSTNSGNMPSLLRSLSSASAAPARSQSLAEPTHQFNGPFARRASALEALTRGLRKKSEIEIVLDGKDEFVRTYSTYDQIKGHLEIQFEKDTVIDDLFIAFEGQSQTYVEKIAAASPTTGRTTGRHTFLRMMQPISSESLPEDMLARAGTTYKIPFSFVVPDRLLPYICSHKVENDEVTKAHLRLPPSLGEPMLAGDGNSLMDDLAPEMSKIIYSVRAKIGKANPTTGRLYDIEEKIARIRVVPAREEEPPMQVDPADTGYALRKEKNVRKGIFKIGKKLGRLTAEVSQPKSLRLPHPNAGSSAPVTTMASVALRFDPASEAEQPPQMANLAARLKVATFFGAASYRILPEVSRCDTWSTVHGMYPENVPLSCRNIGSVQWTKRDPENRKKSVASNTSSESGELSRRESSLSTNSSTSSSSDASIPEASSAYDSSLPFYTAKILVPITLPHKAGSTEDESQSASTRSSLGRGSKKIIFVPSFHTCIVSRSYRLELNLSFHPVNSQGNTTNALSSSSVTLLTPIQISQEGSVSPSMDADDDTLPFDLSLIEGTDEYDEAMARHLDQELNFRNPFSGTTVDRHRNHHFEAIPEYEEVQTTFPDPAAPRHMSVAVPPTNAGQHVVPNMARRHSDQEQPPEYYTPFRTAGAAPIGGRRVSIRS
ncbi:hypothetical protein H2198_010191 [Neophaeococcomyces mojaviensis]|uniref:Uncharacterized protein n=1 Tax=Neophaeococcomyces mojaviensis TaxID=3383035 RepID=A0ACC2ZSI6_9EURO|nr:hypothetical protein H2198_010191 [Knufia sp. JES_112]